MSHGVSFAEATENRQGKGRGSFEANERQIVLEGRSPRRHEHAKR